ncbi:MAG: chorismate-binding protein [Luteibaculum sp.]
MSICISANTELLPHWNNQWFKAIPEDANIPNGTSLYMSSFRGNPQGFHTLTPQEPQTFLKAFCHEIWEDSREEYLKKVDNTIQLIEKNEIDKLVLSRRKFIPLSKGDCKRLATDPCRPIAGKLHYKLYRPALGDFWLGASPEVLISFQEDKFFCHALAGTAKNAEDLGDKEKKEQKAVSDYLMEKLADYQPRISAVQPIKTNHFYHLRNELSWRAKPHVALEIAKKIHPTPAIAGIPQDKAIHLIEQLERSPRDLYTGFLGLSQKNVGVFFVNLRCAKLYEDGICLFAGGGIVKGSDPEKEFEETEMKMEATLADLLG